MSVQERVHDLLSPIVATLGVELLDTEYNNGSLRLTIDRSEDSGVETSKSEGSETSDDSKNGVTTEQLTAVNRLVSPILDQHDPIPGRYTLEVSSPGLERPLKRPGHYQRAIGELILVKLQPGQEQRRLRGVLQAIRSAATADDVDGHGRGDERTVAAAEAGAADGPAEADVPAEADGPAEAGDPAGVDVPAEAGEAVEGALVIVVDVVEVNGVRLDEPERRTVPLDTVAGARTVFEWGPGPKPGQPGSKKAKSGHSGTKSQDPSQPRGAR